jgi:hypothetical protein
MRVLLITILLVAAPASAQMAKPQCATVSNANLPGDLAAWADTAQPLAAAATPGAAPALSPGVHTALTLHPKASLTFAQTPAQERKPENAHGGLVRVKLTDAGVWRLSASKPVWVDMLSGPTAMETSAFGALAPCTPIHKVLEFPLQPGSYLLQFSGNPGPDLEVMLSLKE